MSIAELGWSSQGCAAVVLCQALEDEVPSRCSQSGVSPLHSPPSSTLLPMAGLQALLVQVEARTDSILTVPLQGFVPAAIRLIPHTVLTFVFLEQLRKYFGIKVVT